MDVHNHKGLETEFPHIVTIVVEITKRGEKKHQAYDLTQRGRTRAGRCRKHGFHEECAQKDFYHKIDCHFIFKEPLKVYTLITTDNGITAVLDYANEEIQVNENLNEQEATDNNSELGMYFFIICFKMTSLKYLIKL